MIRTAQKFTIAIVPSTLVGHNCCYLSYGHASHGLILSFFCRKWRGTKGSENLVQSMELVKRNAMNIYRLANMLRSVTTLQTDNQASSSQIWLTEVIVSDRVRVFFYEDHNFSAERQHRLASHWRVSLVSWKGNWSYFDRGGHKAAISKKEVVVDFSARQTLMLTEGSGTCLNRRGFGTFHEGYVCATLTPSWQREGHASSLRVGHFRITAVH